MHVRLREMAARQVDLVARWQLVEAGWSTTAVDDWVARHGWRAVHPGVYALTRSPITRHQRWFAATISAPGTVLSHASAACGQGFRSSDELFTTVTRPGSGGPKRHGGLLVMRSRLLSGEVIEHDGIPMTRPERTVIDLAARLKGRALAKLVREAIRLKAITAYSLLGAITRHRGRRGVAHLRELAMLYRVLPIDRTQSDAEALALEILAGAGIDGFDNNKIIEGEEADLVCPVRRLIIEIDGAQFHLFPSEDLRKQQVWESAGWSVRRLPSDDVFDNPERLVTLARPAERSFPPDI